MGSRRTDLRAHLPGKCQTARRLIRARLIRRTGIAEPPRILRERDGRIEDRSERGIDLRTSRHQLTQFVRFPKRNLLRREIRFQELFRSLLAMVERLCR